MDQASGPRQLTFAALSAFVKIGRGMFGALSCGEFEMSVALRGIASTALLAVINSVNVVWADTLEPFLREPVSPGVEEAGPGLHVQVEDENGPARPPGDGAALSETLPSKKLMNAIAIGYGRFATGRYTPYQPVNNATGGKDLGWESCSAITLCTSDGLFGNLLSATYTRRLYKGRIHNVDIDVQAAYASQGRTYYRSGVQFLAGGPVESFGMLSLVPTYRVSLPKPFHNLSIGAGFGINIATAPVPSEYPYDIPLNTQLNFEVAASPLHDKSLQLTFALQHRCSFFGTLNSVDGKLTGSQWWLVGLRKWF